jgi:polygalacturonase
MSCRNYDPCLDGKLNQIGSYAAAARSSAQNSAASAEQSEDFSQASATSANQSATSATNAANSASDSANSASEANNYLTQVTNIFEDFDERYLGAKSVAPTVDNEGDPLQVGALYWNSSLNNLWAWNGTSWMPVVEGELYIGGFAAAPTLDNEGNPLQLGNLYWNTASNNLWAYNGTAWVRTNFNETTPFLATGTTTTRNLVTRTADVFNVRDFGAVGNGVANDQTAFQLAVNAALAAGGGTVYIPKGTYWFPNPVNATIINVGNGNLTFKGDGETTTILKYSELQSQGRFFNSFNNDPNKGDIIFENLQIQGTLDVNPGRYIGSALYLWYFKNVIIRNCKFKNIAAATMVIEQCQSFKCIDSIFEDIAADGARARDTLDCLVTGNKFLRTGDDPIALHLTGGSYSLLKPNPQAERFIVSNNTAINCAGSCALVAGARKTIITGNTFSLIEGLRISSFFGTAEGYRPIFDLIVSNNSFTDIYAGRNTSSAQVQTIVVSSNTKSTASTNNTIPGDYDSVTGDFIFPSNYTQSNTYNQSGPRTQNIVIEGNTFSKTRSGVAAFSDFGYGQRNSQGIYYNYAVPENHLLPYHVIIFEGQFENVVVSNNTIKDARGNGIIFAPFSGADPNDQPSRYLKNILVTSNLIYNCYDISGIHVQDSGIDSASNSFDVTISNNVINCDPYRLNSNSNNDGTYIAGTSPIGILSNWGRGLKIIGNTFKNCCQTIANFSGGAVVRDNVAHCGKPTGFYFNAANKGIGVIVDGGQISEYIIEDSDPTSGVPYLQVSSAMQQAALAMPTTGWYIRGSFVRNYAPSIDANGMVIMGWVRLTSNNTHVAGVDWAVARVSNVSPAT